MHDGRFVKILVAFALLYALTANLVRAQTCPRCPSGWTEDSSDVTSVRCKKATGLFTYKNPNDGSCNCELWRLCRMELIWLIIPCVRPILRQSGYRFLLSEAWRRRANISICIIQFGDGCSDFLRTILRLRKELSAVPRCHARFE